MAVGIFFHPRLMALPLRKYFFSASITNSSKILLLVWRERPSLQGYKRAQPSRHNQHTKANQET